MFKAAKIKVQMEYKCSYITPSTVTYIKCLCAAMYMLGTYNEFSFLVLLFAKTREMYKKTNLVWYRIIISDNVRNV